MAHECQHELVGRDAGAVVADANGGLPGPADIDADPARAGVERVLDQLFDDRRGPLDHLARGNRVRDLGGQHLDHQVNLARS